jgi:hypothetical protein
MSHYATTLRGPASHNLDEAAWWKDAGIDPARAPRKLWNESRMNRGGSVWTDVANPTAARTSRHHT